MLASAGLAYRLGQDINWDLRNYHFYGPYAALEGRLDRDVHAAGVQTFLNPILNLPLYFAVRAGIRPVFFGLTLAALQGIALWCVHRLTQSVVPRASSAVGHYLGVLAAVTAAFGAAFHGELGNSTGDTIVATCVLIALMLLIERAPNFQKLYRTYAIAGALLGLAIGAKQVAGIYGPGLVCVVWMAGNSHRRRVLCTVVFLLGAVAGVGLTGGYWMWLMQDRFGSPLFPFYNLVFRSDWAPLRDFATDIYAPLAGRQVPFALPFLFLREQLVSAEAPFRDGRLAVAVISVLVFTVTVLARRRLPAEAGARVAWWRLAMLAVFFTTSYIVWSHTMTLYRFAMPLELLSGVLAIGVITNMLSRRALQLAVPTAIGIALVFSTKTLNLDRIPWKNDFFGVSTSDFVAFHDATIILADFPTAYVVPFFPDSATFVRLASNWGLEPDSWMERRALMRIQLAQPGRLFTLVTSTGPDAVATEAALTRLGFAVDASACRSFEAHVEHLQLCRVARR